MSCKILHKHSYCIYKDIYLIFLLGIDQFCCNIKNRMCVIFCIYIYIYVFIYEYHNCTSVLCCKSRVDPTFVVLSLNWGWGGDFKEWQWWVGLSDL